MTAPKHTPSDWVVVDATKGGASVCLRCGAEVSTKFPIRLTDWVDATRAFERRHRKCEARPAPEVPK